MLGGTKWTGYTVCTQTHRWGRIAREKPEYFFVLDNEKGWDFTLMSRKSLGMLIKDTGLQKC